MNNAAHRFRFDHAAIINKGAREYQEDALITDFTHGADVNFAVLADGMGGHAAGDVASKIVVTKVFAELMLRRGDMAIDLHGRDAILRGAAETANIGLDAHVATHPDTRGMGATLVALIVIGDCLHWISVGDSPLYLYRDNVLQQLNEDHSLGPHIDMLVRSGALSAEEGQNHPERNVLTSVLLGQDIAQIDCPAQPFKLLPGDTLIVASDGLQFLRNEDIAQILRERPFARSSDIADALLARLNALEDPDLDNITMSVVQVQNAMAPSPHRMVTPARPQPAPVVRWPFRKRRLDANQVMPAQRRGAQHE